MAHSKNQHFIFKINEITIEGSFIHSNERGKFGKVCMILLLVPSEVCQTIILLFPFFFFRSRTVDSHYIKFVLCDATKDCDLIINIIKTYLLSLSDIEIFSNMLFSFISYLLFLFLSQMFNFLLLKTARTCRCHHRRHFFS